jgi:hypothetical protein
VFVFHQGAPLSLASVDFGTGPAHEGAASKMISAPSEQVRGPNGDATLDVCRTEHFPGSGSAKLAHLRLSGRPSIPVHSHKSYDHFAAILHKKAICFQHRALQPAANAGFVVEIDAAELAFEIGFFTGDHAVADDKIEWHQGGEYPQIVEADCEAGLP